MKRRWVWLVLAVLTACSDNTGPEGAVDESELTFLRFSSMSAITVRQASFWAKLGTSRKLTMYYAPSQPGETGETFLEFEVGSASLLRRPNGTLFLPGDSVLISVQLDNSDRFILHFEPSGLIFNPVDQPKLEINYLHADRDLDNDGDEDEHDDALEAALRIWKRELAGLPWLPLASVRIDDDEIEARVLSFTSFAMASN